MNNAAIAAITKVLPKNVVIQEIRTEGGDEPSTTITFVEKRTLEAIAKRANEAAEAEAKAEPKPVEEITYEEAPEPEPVEVPQPLEVDEAERLPTYADETAVGEAERDSNADAVPDVSAFAFQPPVEEPTDTSTPAESA